MTDQNKSEGINIIKTISDKLIDQPVSIQEDFEELEQDNIVYNHLLENGQLDNIRGNYVAIHKSKLICWNISRDDLIREAYTKSGYVSMLIQYVPKKDEVIEESFWGR